MLRGGEEYFPSTVDDVAFLGELMSIMDTQVRGQSTARTRDAEGQGTHCQVCAFTNVRVSLWVSFWGAEAK